MATPKSTQHAAKRMGDIICQARGRQPELSSATGCGNSLAEAGSVAGSEPRAVPRLGRAGDDMLPNASCLLHECSSLSPRLEDSEGNSRDDRIRVASGRYVLARRHATVHGECAGRL